MVNTRPGRLMVWTQQCDGGARGSHARTVESQLPVSTSPGNSKEEIPAETSDVSFQQQ